MLALIFISKLEEILLFSTNNSNSDNNYNCKNEENNDTNNDKNNSIKICIQDKPDTFINYKINKYFGYY